MKRVLFAALIVLLSGCDMPNEWRYTPNSADDSTAIYVVRHGWHTGIVIPGDKLNPELEILNSTFGHASYYEIGWGDRGLYKAKEIKAGITIRALFWPTSAVMQVVALPDPPSVYFPHSQILEIKLSSEGYSHLLKSIADSFKWDQSGNPIVVEEGSYGHSYFFKAVGLFFITNTCNSWTARMLASAGLPVDPLLTIRAESVMNQTRKALGYYDAGLRKDQPNKQQ